MQPSLRDHGSHTSSTMPDCPQPHHPSLDPPNLTLATACLSSSAYWYNRAPGTGAQYSNLGAAWAARRLEQVAGVDFDTFTRDRIFNPLQMTQTGWSRAALGNQMFAEGYYANRTTQTQEYGVSPYAMGNLRASARDLARFMIMWTDLGVGPNGARILEQASVGQALVQHRSISGFGFFWGKGTMLGREVWGHGGVLAGVCTRLNIDPGRREGVAVLMNGPCANVGADLDAIELAAFQALRDL
jgi:CubicO group peptidase (beta-lactamase class C family)